MNSLDYLVKEAMTFTEVRIMNREIRANRNSINYMRSQNVPEDKVQDYIADMKPSYGGYFEDYKLNNDPRYGMKKHQETGFIGRFTKKPEDFNSEYDANIKQMLETMPRVANIDYESILQEAAVARKAQYANQFTKAMQAVNKNRLLKYPGYAEGGLK